MRSLVQPLNSRLCYCVVLIKNTILEMNEADTNIVNSKCIGSFWLGIIAREEETDSMVLASFKI